MAVSTRREVVLNNSFSFVEHAGLKDVLGHISVPQETRGGLLAQLGDLHASSSGSVVCVF